MNENRNQIFNKNKHKIVEIEKLLTGKEEIVIDAASGVGTELSLDQFSRSRGGHISKILNGVLIANVQERGNNAHSIILVKNDKLSMKWSIFDANGKKNLPFKINNNGVDVTLNYLEITGNNSLNNGSDRYNPGYCGTIGIIFMVFFHNNKYDINWPEKWLNIYNFLSDDISSDRNRGSRAVELASKIQLLIYNTPTISNSILQDIYKLLMQTVSHTLVNNQNSYTRKRISRSRSRSRSLSRSRSRSISGGSKKIRLTKKKKINSFFNFI